MRLRTIHEARDYLLLYHGTSASKCRKILNVGMVYADKLTTTPNADPGYSYVASDPYLAIDYMDYNGDHDKGLVVLRANRRYLLPDEDLLIGRVIDGIKGRADPQHIALDIEQWIDGFRPGSGRRLAQLIKQFVNEFTASWAYRGEGPAPTSDGRDVAHRITRALRGVDLGGSYRIKTPISFRGSASVIGAIIMVNGQCRIVGHVPAASELCDRIVAKYGT